MRGLRSKWTPLYWFGDFCGIEKMYYTRIKRMENFNYSHFKIIAPTVNVDNSHAHGMLTINSFYYGVIQYLF